MRTLPRLVPALALATAALSACARQTVADDPTRTAALKQEYDQLHARLEKAVKGEPLVAAAFADRGQVVLAIRSELLEKLAGTVARRYLDHVSLDLEDVKAHSSGEVRRKTFLGRVKIGEWNVGVELGNLVGDLRAGSPRVSLRGPNLIDLDIPVDVQETTGEATLHFGWDSSGLANAVCKDFELTRGIQGRVLAQHHVLRGALRLENRGDTLTATPVFPDRSVTLHLDLTPPSWAVVEEALQSQNTSATCGPLMHPQQGLAFLKGLAAKGIGVRLPRSIFRTVNLPTRLQESVRVNGRPVRLRLKAESLRIEGATLWSSASVEVEKNPKNGSGAETSPPNQKVTFTKPK